jgi:hypothetical protein
MLIKKEGFCPLLYGFAGKLRSIFLYRSSSSYPFTVSCYLQVKRIVTALSLKKEHIFSSLKHGALQHIAKKCAVYKITEGALLMKQGDVADCLYVVISGGFRVSRDFLQTPPEFANATELAFIEHSYWGCCELRCRTNFI